MMKHTKHLLVLWAALLLGAGNAWGADFSQTYSYGLTDWSLTNYSDKSSYYLVPSSGTSSVATIPGIFTGKTIISKVVITINCATYGSGTNPSATTFAVYTASDCATAVTATQGGTLPTSSTYKDVTYTITQSNAAAFTNDLAIKITKPGKQIRLKSIKVVFTYETGSTGTTLYFGLFLAALSLCVLVRVGLNASTLLFIISLCQRSIFEVFTSQKSALFVSFLGFVLFFVDKMALFVIFFGRTRANLHHFDGVHRNCIRHVVALPKRPAGATFAVFGRWRFGVMAWCCIVRLF